MPKILRSAFFFRGTFFFFFFFWWSLWVTIAGMMVSIGGKISGKLNILKEGKGHYISRWRCHAFFQYLE